MRQELPFTYYSRPEYSASRRHKDIWQDYLDTGDYSNAIRCVAGNQKLIRRINRIDAEEDFDKTIGDYLTFEFAMIMQGREYLFADNQSFRQPETGVGSSQNNPGDENE